MRKFIKNHWFELIMIAIIILFLAEFFLILSAPHEDENNRGFSFCTNNMIDNVSNCNRRTWCTFKAVSNNYICYNIVILKGFKNWINKKSPTPWSDYFYDPQSTELQEELVEFYEQNPNIEEQMQTLMEKKLELGSKQNDKK